MINNNSTWGSKVEGGAYSIESRLKKKGGIIYRHIEWSQKERSQLKTVSVTLFNIATCAVLTGSILGIPVVLKARKISKKQESYRLFKTVSDSRTPPPMDLKIELKTDTQTLCHS
jgi:hypothetical protein